MSIEYIGMIMYDLPMYTDNEILRYKNFRKKLIEKDITSFKNLCIL